MVSPHLIYGICRFLHENTHGETRCEVRSTPHTIPKRKQSHGVINDLDNVDFVSSNTNSCREEALSYVVEDNEAVIKMIIKGRSPTMRHVSRTHVFSCCTYPEDGKVSFRNIIVECDGTNSSLLQHTPRLGPYHRFLCCASSRGHHSKCRGGSCSSAVVFLVLSNRQRITCSCPGCGTSGNSRTARDRCARASGELHLAPDPQFTIVLSLSSTVLGCELSWIFE